MMKKFEDVGLLLARILMPILFITAGWGKITGYAGTQQYMEAMGVPGFMLPLVILLEFGGGLAILFGFLTRFTALFTAGFTILTAFLFHSNFAEGVNQLMFMKNLSIAGGFLVLGLVGPGAYSIDRLISKRKPQPAIAR
jgi:putative oxidoreductase